MSQHNIERIEKIVDAGTSLASQVSSKIVSLDNYQSAKVIIFTSEGTETKANVHIVARTGDALEQEIKSQEITIGTTNKNEINIVANELAHYDAKSFQVVIDAIDGTSITATVDVLLGNARYAEENDNPIEDVAVATEPEQETQDETEPSGDEITE